MDGHIDILKMKLNISAPRIGLIKFQSKLEEINQYQKRMKEWVEGIRPCQPILISI